MNLFKCKKNKNSKNLILILLFFLILVDLEVSKLIAFFGVSHNTQPVSEIVLL